ncbi:MAG TPA: ABC transporter ATP-binding protein [Gammaproteobacteria bacterium]|nr:ABC transporter ATP-binding protein [Gammaproteobacteria bacterium]
MSRLSLHELSVRIAGKTVCEQLTMSLQAGRCIGLLGANGVGKTTFLLTLAGLRAPAAGRIELDGRDLATLGRRRTAQRLGMLMQQHADPFPASVLETCLSGRHPHIGFWQWESQQDHEIALQALQVTGMQALAERDVHALSGGERRRLGIATLLAQQPDVFLLDEPVDQLDLYHQMRLLAHFRELAERENKLVLMSLHDVNMAARFCDEVLLLFGNGELLHGPTYRVLTTANLERLYGIPVRMIVTEDALFFQPG